MSSSQRFPGDGCHRGIVRAQRHRSDEQSGSFTTSHLFELVSQRRVGGDASADTKCIAPSLLQGLSALADKNVNNRGLKAGRDIGDALRGQRFGFDV